MTAQDVFRFAIESFRQLGHDWAAPNFIPWFSFMKIEIFIRIIDKISLYLQKIFFNSKYRKIPVPASINNLIPVVVQVKP